jgi:hypothetical protein
MGAVGLDWQVLGFGAFGINPNESDMLMRNTNTGALEVYDLYNKVRGGITFFSNVRREALPCTFAYLSVPC